MLCACSDAEQPPPLRLGAATPGDAWGSDGTAGNPRRAASRAGSSGSASARYHWQLLRLEAKLRIARRRQLLKAWWGAVEGATRRCVAGDVCV